MISFLKKIGFFALLTLVTFFLVGLTTWALKETSINKLADMGGSKLASNQQTTSTSEQVLGRSTSPEIYIRGGDNSYGSAGMIALASTDDPAVQIGGYAISNQTDISVYRANLPALIEYLTHDAEWKQTKKVDTTGFDFVAKVSKAVANTGYEGTKVTLPFEETGIWYLLVENGSIKTEAFVIRSDYGVLAKEGDNEFIFWGQSFKTKKSVSDGIVEVVSLLDKKTTLSTVSFNADGIAKAPINAAADIALVTRGEDFAIVPLNLKYINTGYNYTQFQEKVKDARYFVFTDRPLYKPGDTVYFKAVLRDDDDARYTIPEGSAKVEIFDGYYWSGDEKKPLYEQSIAISPEGTISGQYKLPENAGVGYYSLSVKLPGRTSDYYDWGNSNASSTISFSVEYFRKPEFSLDIEAPDTEFIASDEAQITIKGSYFSGQPLVNQKVAYTVYSDDFYEYQYLVDRQNILSNLDDSYRYSYWYRGGTVTSGVAVLDKRGEAKIAIDTKLTGKTGKSQVFTVEATLEDGSQAPSFARRNLIVYAGQWGIYKNDYSYATRVNNEYKLPVTLVSYNANVKVSGVALKAKVHRENWVAHTVPGRKYPEYKKEEEDLPEISATTDNEGRTTLKFTPKKTGQYKISVSGTDSRGNLIAKDFWAYVTNRDEPYYTQYGNNFLTLSKDRENYKPEDSAILGIYSEAPNRDVLLTLERGRVDRYQVLHMTGKNIDLELPLVASDTPNIYANVASFANDGLDTDSLNLQVSPEGKRLVVQITPNAKTFGPGETTTANVLVTDRAGNPQVADVALWAVDKAIFELSDNRLGDIFKAFWSERGNTTRYAQSLEGITVINAEMGGGCFVAGTKVLMSDGSTKNIEDVKVGDRVLTFSQDGETKVIAEVTGTHQAKEAGVLIVNGDLKLTAEHILKVNGNWQDAGSIQLGDTLTGLDGPEKVTSLEWQTGKFTVYNLEIADHHTFIAQGVWVHNQKGEVRNTFKDAAYWNPAIKTDSNGRATVSFKLPDNLTTWTLAAVAQTRDTKVGQTTSEIVVTKDVIVRPIVPNIMRQGDEIVLSALVQNFTEQNDKFDIALKFDAGEVEEANLKAVEIAAKDMQQVYWTVRPKVENQKAKLTFSAKSPRGGKLTDTVILEVPVIPFGFEEKRAQTGEGDKVYDLSLAQDIAPERSSVVLSLAPTIIGTLPTAMAYLVDYPYGCVEQTTSKFVPAVIAKENPVLFAQALKGKDVDDMIKKGVTRLVSLQQYDGGWGWWYSGNSNPFITAYVTEYLLRAKALGVEVDDNMLARVQDYAKRTDSQYNSREDLIAKAYALSLMTPLASSTKVTNLDNLTPDMLALAVMANYQSGETNPATNGLTKLIAMARAQGDGVFWESGSSLNFGSTDASTALAIKAVIVAGGDDDIARRGANYLMRSRKYDYWSNTFATSQIVEAITKLVKTGEELTPNYTYTVKLDGKAIAQGAVSSSQKTLPDIVVPLNKVNKESFSVEVDKTGDGRLYSTVAIKEFHTDRSALAKEEGIKVERSYVNEKGEEYTIGVGDIVNVNIKLSNVAASGNYGVIQDELPAGLVPINESFKNEQYAQSASSYYNSGYGVTDRDITQNGIILSLYKVNAGSYTYTYRARVVNSGVFVVPPAIASLMYAPEVHGRSGVQTLTVDAESRIIPGVAIRKTIDRGITQIASGKSVVSGFVIIASVILLGLILIFRKKLKVSEKFVKSMQKLFKKRRKDPPSIKAHIFNDPKPL